MIQITKNTKLNLNIFIPKFETWRIYPKTNKHKKIQIKYKITRTFVIILDFEYIINNKSKEKFFLQKEYKHNPKRLNEIKATI